MTQQQPVMSMQQQTPVVAQITGADLLGRLDALSTSMQTLAVKLDDVPHQVADHEQRLRSLERRSVVTWPQMLALSTMFLALLGVVAAFLAVVIK